ncbi:MAG: ORF6N domain-containing protein [Bacteroidaceae bacterium]|nr:ORF6N domain-containing protein [Bacteroidaceae bacterium]
MENEIITTKDVQDKIVVVRGKNVLLDRDVATLYGVETKAINQAVKNNPDKFPEGFLFQLSSDEKEEVVKNFDHLEVIKFSPVLPTAFTSRGLYMLATILKSKNAVKTTIAIIDTFANVQELAGTVEQMQHAPDGEDLQKKLLQKTGELMGEIIGQNLSTRAVETEIELNFAVVKIRHKFIRGGKGE